jgi:V8-like Glu-specific endopeptidase
MAYLNADEINEVVQAAMAAELGANAARNVLISALNQGYANTLFDVGGNPMFQLYADLNAMNSVDQLSDGSVPLRDWLRQAGFLARQALRREADVFTKFEVRVDAEASGQHSLPDPANLREVVNNEDIVHRDDMVDFWFLSAGMLAGKSVAKLLVPRYENDVLMMGDNGPRRTIGTGWLITDRHIITNHHVVKCRKKGDPQEAVSDADLLLQGANTTVRFDYDDADDTGNDVDAEKLEAWNEPLDFAILRLKMAVAPKPLQILNQPVVFNAGTYVPVNIIQHPSGHPKRVALRNNLLTSADENSIRYFTDTLTGSSGAPVFDDAWRVIALHRGSQAVRDVSFQGRDVAVVNVGTQITAILKYLNAHHNDLRKEIKVRVGG